MNFVVFYVFAQGDALAQLGITGLITGAVNLLPVGLALIITSLANGLLNAGMKARLVFFRWNQALPGHRAFTEHGPADPRVDMDHLKKVLGDVPVEPSMQNRDWYRLYKEVENDPAIAQIHREFIFNRDYASFAFLFFAIFGSVSFYYIPSANLAMIYVAILFAQFIVVRHAAATYGVRFVTTVLARKSVKPTLSAPKVGSAEN